MMILLPDQDLSTLEEKVTLTQLKMEHYLIAKMFR